MLTTTDMRGRKGGGGEEALARSERRAKGQVVTFNTGSVLSWLDVPARCGEESGRGFMLPILPSHYLGSTHLYVWQRENGFILSRMLHAMDVCSALPRTEELTAPSSGSVAFLCRTSGSAELLHSFSTAKTCVPVTA